MREVMLSVIIPVYNVEKYITECVNSIISQTNQNFEAIFIDDGSCDSSGIIIQELIKDKNNLKLIRQRNCGSGAARNTGIDMAKGKYITFLDSDDWIMPDCIENVIKLINRGNEKVDLAVWGYSIYFQDENRIEENRPKRNGSFTGKTYLEYILDEYGGAAGSVCCKAYRRELIEKENIRFGNYKTAEDGHFNTKCLKYLERIVLGDFVGCVYRREDYIIHSKNLFFCRPNFFGSSVDVTADREKLLHEAIKVHNLGEIYENKFYIQMWKSFESINMQNAVYNLNIFDKLKTNRQIARKLLCEEMKVCCSSISEKRLIDEVKKYRWIDGGYLLVWNYRYRGYFRDFLIYLFAGVIFPKEKKIGRYVRRLLKI